jgi:hypothetical protein
MHGQFHLFKQQVYPEPDHERNYNNLIASNSDSITSLLTVVAFEQLSGTVVSCTNGLLPDGESEAQETTIIILTAGNINRLYIN